MAAYVLVDIAVKDPEAYERYKQLAPASIAAYGGKYLVRGGAKEVLEGPWDLNRFVILEFESVERAKAWWASPEYAPAKAMRFAAADSKMVLVDGV